MPCSVRVDMLFALVLGSAQNPLLPSGFRPTPQAAGVLCRSKNSAWLIAAFTVAGWKGLVMRKAGSGARRSGGRSG